MANSFNKYASQLFSEHPTAIWPLDNEAYFVSLISEENKNLLNWNLSNCSIEAENPSLPDSPSPFEGNDEYFEIVGEYQQFSISGGLIEIKSEPIFSFNNISELLKTISLNLYLYQESTRALSYEFGIEYFDTSISQQVQVLSRIDASDTKTWLRFLETFEINEFDSDTCQIVLKIYVSQGGASDEYSFIVHGLSVGQWSEQFSSISTGSIAEEVQLAPSKFADVVRAKQYGPASDDGYYVIGDNNLLLAKNDGFPLVYGSKNSTGLLANSIEGEPSFIFPNKGMLSNRGRNNTYSLEFWAKIKPNTKKNRKIFGPLLSDYGIYVSEGFLTLSIGNKIQSHNIGEWNRPMLIHLLYSPTNAQLFVNGEQVIDLNFNQDEVSFVENNWSAFYSYIDVEVFDIDCISLFPYTLPLQVAKRRFVWGQGVESSETIDSSFKAETTVISFPNSGYSSNIVYPDKEKWSAGYYNNLEVGNSSISVPQYSLPEIFLSGRSPESWYRANKKVNQTEYVPGTHPNFFTFRPNLANNDTEWQLVGPDWNEKCYLKFTTANIFSAPISAIYGVFETKDFVDKKRPLIHIINSLSNERFEINIDGNNLIYEFNGSQIIDPIDTSLEDHVVVGFHIPTISERFGYEFSSFFSTYDFLTMYVGGAPDTISKTYETFEGKVYKVSFADYGNYELVSSHFNENGIANYEDDSFFSDHYSTYSAMPFVKYDRFFLDISLAASWEEYYPLSYFANYSNDLNGSPSYNLDFLQFNVDYPSYIEEKQEVFLDPLWRNYSEFEMSYRFPIRKSYEVLDNSSITGYSDYSALEKNEKTKTILDTSNSSVEIFATFQLISEGANEPIQSFVYTRELEKDKSVDPSLENSNEDRYRAYRTKFKIVDGTLIYPPKNIKFEDVALVLHFSIKQDAILKNPLKIRDMEITAKSLNAAEANPIGTKYGNKIYPYSKSGIYFNYKSQNPLLIYKKNTPYLHLTENSGIRLLKRPAPDVKEYGVSIPINKNKQLDYSVAAVQMFVKSDIGEEINTPFPVFEISSSSKTIEFVAKIDDSGLRYEIYPRDKKTKNIEENIDFYQNGISVQSFFVLKNKWSVLSFIFKVPFNFSQSSGSINVFPGFSFDNISTFPASSFTPISAIIANVWNDTLYIDKRGDLNDPNNIYGWEDWVDDNWGKIFIAASESRYSLTPADIYSSYTGTNVNVIDDNSGIKLTNEDFVVFSDVIWSPIIGKPA